MSNESARTNKNESTPTPRRHRRAGRIALAGGLALLTAGTGALLANNGDSDSNPAATTTTIEIPSVSPAETLRKQAAEYINKYASMLEQISDPKKVDQKFLDEHNLISAELQQVAEVGGEGASSVSRDANGNVVTTQSENQTSRVFKIVRPGPHGNGMTTITVTANSPNVSMDAPYAASSVVSLDFNISSPVATKNGKTAGLEFHTASISLEGMSFTEGVPGYSQADPTTPTEVKEGHLDFSGPNLVASGSLAPTNVRDGMANVDRLMEVSLG